MSSDVTSDSRGKAEPTASPHRKGERWSSEQRGLICAALVAFLGVAYVGPTFRRMARKPRFADRAAVRLEEARRRARQGKFRLQKRVRRLRRGATR